MDKTNTLKIFGVVVSVVGAIASVAGTLIDEKQQTNKINKAVAEAIAKQK